MRNKSEGRLEPISFRRTVAINYSLLRAGVHLIGKRERAQARVPRPENCFCSFEDRCKIIAFQYSFKRYNDKSGVPLFITPRVVFKDYGTDKHDGKLNYSKKIITLNKRQTQEDQEFVLWGRLNELEFQWFIEYRSIIGWMRYPDTSMLPRNRGELLFAKALMFRPLPHLAQHKTNFLAYVTEKCKQDKMRAVICKKQGRVTGLATTISTWLHD